MADLLALMVLKCFSQVAKMVDGSAVINPRRACADRVTVVVSCVCLYVCMSVRTRYSGSTRN